MPACRGIEAPSHGRGDDRHGDRPRRLGMGGRLYIAVREGGHCIGTGGTAGADAAEDMGAAPAVLRGGTERGILPGMSILLADEAGKWHNPPACPINGLAGRQGLKI